MGPPRALTATGDVVCQGGGVAKLASLKQFQPIWSNGTDRRDRGQERNHGNTLHHLASIYSSVRAQAQGKFAMLS